jgi:hypothetical protein
VSLHQIYQEFQGQVKFIKIYIREAHPVDGWWFGRGLSRVIMRTFSAKVSLDIYDPVTIEERRAAATECEASLQYGVKTYVDEIDDRVSKAYAAWPTRLYLINKEGIVVYAGGPGPFGFKPGEFKTALQTHLEKEEIA